MSSNRLNAFRLSTLWSLLLGLAAVVFVGGFAPEPDAVPKRWELDVKPGELRLATINDANGNPRAYMYFSYRVTNSTKTDLLFAPAFDLATEDTAPIRSGREVPAAVTRNIIERLGNPLVNDQISILGQLLQGPENAKDGVVVWPAPDLHANEITVYAAGFSGETKTIEVPDTTPGAKAGATKQILLRKTLMMRFRVAGEISEWGNKPFQLVEKRWILR